MNPEKIALVTGANRGIGFEVSRQLGALGFTVLLGCRNPAHGEKAQEILHAEAITAKWIVTGCFKLKQYRSSSGSY